MNKKVLGFIPARGGSKSIPRKNIFPLVGKPLIAYAIEALKHSQFVNRIVVSTDDEEIAAIAKKFGAEVPFFRPKELAKDTSQVFAAIKYTINRLKKEEKYYPDYVVTIQPTSPLVQTSQIDAALKLVFKKKAESVVTVKTLPHHYHPHNIRKVKEGKTSFWMELEHYKSINRQQRPVFYAFGNLYVSRVDLIEREGHLEGKNNYQIVIDHLSALDIDDIDDFKIIEALIKAGIVKTS